MSAGRSEKALNYALHLIHPPPHLPLLPAFVLRGARSVRPGEPRTGALLAAYASFLGRVPKV